MEFAEKCKNFMCASWEDIKEKPIESFLWFCAAFFATVFMLIIIWESAAMFWIGKFGFELSDTPKPETLKFVGWIIGGILAVIGVIAVNRRADAQTKIAEEQAENNKLIGEGHIEERFKAAIEHLGHDAPRMRIVAYYEFYQLAQAHPNLRKIIFYMFCAHLREITNAKDYEGKGKPTEGVQTLLNLLFKPEDKSVFQRLRADLRRVNLAGADLVGAHMPNTDFTNACLIGANMRYADLHASNFTCAKMHGSALQDAKMPLAQLVYTALNGSNISNANLQCATMVCADFRGSRCENTQMHINKLYMLPPESERAYMGGVFGRDAYDGFLSVIRRQIGARGNIRTIHFVGGRLGLFEDQIRRTMGFLREYVDEKSAQKYWDMMEKEMKIVIPRTMNAEEMAYSHTDLNPYTPEDAEKWISEYNEAMGKNSDKE